MFSLDFDCVPPSIADTGLGIAVMLSDEPLRAIPCVPMIAAAVASGAVTTAAVAVVSDVFVLILFETVDALLLFAAVVVKPAETTPKGSAASASIAKLSLSHNVCSS